MLKKKQQTPPKKTPNKPNQTKQTTKKKPQTKAVYKLKSFLSKELEKGSLGILKAGTGTLSLGCLSTSCLWDSGQLT